MPDNPNTGSNARLRQWISEQIMVLIAQNPLGASLGQLVIGLRALNNTDVQEIDRIDEDNFYHRVIRSLDSMVKDGLINKDGLTYFHRNPEDRALEGIKKQIETAYPGLHFKMKDLAPFRAALDGLVEKAQAAPSKTTRPKRGTSKID